MSAACQLQGFDLAMPQRLLLLTIILTLGSELQQIFWHWIQWLVGWYFAEVFLLFLSFPLLNLIVAFVFFVAEENMLWRAKNYGDAKLYQQATDIKTPSCDKIQQIYSWLIALDMVCGVCVSVLIPSYLRSFVLSVHMSVLGRKNPDVT